MNLRYCMFEAIDAGETRHPQEVMKDLGITYRHAIPQSMGDQWWFIDCEAKELPPYLTEMEFTQEQRDAYLTN